MPIYQYKCPKHPQVDLQRRVKNRNRKIRCKECGGVMVRVATHASKIKIFKPIVLEHIADKPMFFDSERVLRRYCRANKVESSLLL